MNLIKIKTFIQKRHCEENKRYGRDWETIFPLQIYDHGLVFGIYKEFLKLEGKNMTQCINGQKVWTDLHKRRCVNGQQAPEKMFSVIDNWRNAN